MKLIIAGGRDFVPQPCHVDWLNALRQLQVVKHDPIDEVVSGRQRGADKFGEDWAKANRIHVKPFPANWKLHGNAAGPIRNSCMAEHLSWWHRQREAVAVILFPGSKGTQSMYDEAKKRELTIFDWRNRNE